MVLASDKFYSIFDSV